MAVTPSSYQQAFDDAKQELAGLILIEEKITRRKVELRKTIEVLTTLCQSEGVEIEPSREAEYLLDNSTLADEVRNILKARYPAWLRPNEIKLEIERLGQDLTRYDNPQATIQMVLKRMVEAKDAEEKTQEGKRTYRSPSQNLNALSALNGTLDDTAEIKKAHQRAMESVYERIRSYSSLDLGLGSLNALARAKPREKI